MWLKMREITQKSWLRRRCTLVPTEQTNTTAAMATTRSVPLQDGVTQSSCSCGWQQTRITRTFFSATTKLPAGLVFAPKTPWEYPCIILSTLISALRHFEGSNQLLKFARFAFAQALQTPHFRNVPNAPSTKPTNHALSLHNMEEIRTVTCILAVQFASNMKVLEVTLTLLGNTRRPPSPSQCCGPSTPLHPSQRAPAWTPSSALPPTPWRAPLCSLRGLHPRLLGSQQNATRDQKLSEVMNTRKTGLYS